MFSLRSWNILMTYTHQQIQNKKIQEKVQNGFVQHNCEYLFL